MELDKKYQTGVLWQDTQHSQLISLLDDLRNANARGADPKMFTYTTAFLVMYVSHHFNLEEEYMETYEYPDREYHIQQHHHYIEMIKSFRKAHTRFSEEGAQILEQTILGWIMEHILDNDMKLGEFIRNSELEDLLGRQAAE